MKKQLIYWITAAVITISFGCKNDGSGSNDAQMELHKKVYKQSTDVGDLPTAINALRYIVAVDSNNSQLIDTLANLYYTVGQVYQSIKVCDQFMSKYPATEKIMETKELCFEKLNMPDSAYELADKLFLKTQKLKYEYRKGYYKVQMGDFNKGFESLKKVIEHKGNINDSTEMRFTNEGFAQMIPIKAAAYFVRGNGLVQLRKYNEAKEDLKMALKEYPDFYYANRLLQNFDKFVQEAEMQMRR